MTVSLQNRVYSCFLKVLPVFWSTPVWENSLDGGDCHEHEAVPVIDPIATGKNIIRLRVERGMSVRDLQAYFGFEEPQAIYKWQQGKSLPSVDNLYALGALFEVPMEDILVSRTSQLNLIICEQQAEACCSPLFMGELLRLSRIRQRAKIA